MSDHKAIKAVQSSKPIKLPIFETMRMAFSKVSGSKAVFFGPFFVFVLLIIAKYTLKVALTTNTFEGLLGLDVSNFMHYLLVSGFVFLTIGVLIFSLGLCYLGIQRALDKPISVKVFSNIFDLKILLNCLVAALIFVFMLFLMFFVPLVLTTILLHGQTILYSSDQIAISKLLLALAYVIFIIVGLYLAFRAILCFQIVLAENINGWAAFKKSFALTKSNVCRLMVIALLNCLIIMGTVLTLGIAFIWTAPYIYICRGMVYKRLAGV